MKLVYVRGHQDKKVAFRNLELPAQLNVEADALAGAYVYQNGKDPTRVPRISGNDLQLHTLEGTITRNYRQLIRRIASRPAMKQYICTTNQWTNDDFEGVDWECHGTSVRKWYYRKQFITKFVHDWLPLGKLLSKYKPHYSSKCPSCNHEVEDRDHFLRCPGRKWQAEFFEALRPYLNRHKTRPVLDDLLNECLRSWLSNSEIRLSGYPVLYHRLILNQYKIGWNQLFLGRFVKEWSELQDDHLVAIKNGDRKLTGRIWITGLITLLWEHIYKNWEERNANLHGHDANSREAALLLYAQSETAHLYDIRAQVLSRDTDLFYSTIEIHYEKEPTSTGLRQWLNTWQPVILASIAESKQKGLQGVRALTRFFQQVPSSSSTTTAASNSS
jgi:hypothetical protein